ncbi:hypothetical protein [Adhaeribacter terreus]|uniref:Nucleotidyl transferase AbiEii toxin, Type IV TA system n=1 Tax=Adhaeribacter terreus TaxID=529703 RepID=A0ABW0EC54_9BACT
MNLLDAHFLQFLDLLNKHEVEYLLVGGHAVILHGYPRSTGDMDIWVSPTNKNASKLVKAVDEYGFDASALLDMDFTQMLVFDVGTPPAHIEIMNYISGVDFQTAFAQKKMAEMEGTSFNLIHLSDLRKNKAASARYKDLDDLEHLNKL